MSEILINFKATGHEDIVTALREIKAETNRIVGTSNKTAKSVAKLTAKVHAQGLSWQKLGVNYREVRKAAKGSQVSMEKLRMAMRKTTKASGGLLRNNRLLAGSFATMRSKLLLFNFMMGLVVNRIIEMAQQASKVNNMERAFDSLTGASESAAAGVSKIRAATQGTVSDFNLLQQANNAMILGVTKNTDEMADMFDMAKRLGDALGRDTASSIESLVTGIGRQSRLMLDNIGIIVKSEDAYKAYADQLGVSVSSLTDADKKQAFMNATLDAARKKVAQLGPPTKKTSDQFAQFGATMENVATEVGATIAPTLGNFAENISDFISDLMLSDLEQLARDLKSVGVASKDLQSITDAISLEKALENLDDNVDKFSDLTTKMQDGTNAMVFSLSDDFGSLGSGSFLQPMQVFEQALQTMGATTQSVTNSSSGNIRAFFENIENLESDKIIEGSQLLVQEMLRLSSVVADDKEKLRELQDQLKQDPGNENLIERVEKTQNSIDANINLTNQFKNRIGIIAQLLSATVGYEKAMGFLNGTLDENGKLIDENDKKLKAEFTTLSERAVLLQQQLLVDEQIKQLKEDTFPTDEKKLQADKRANQLLKEQISIKNKLMKLDNADLDQKLKAANKLGNAIKSGMELFGASAKQTANIEALMAIINAFGSALKIKNSKMMQTNPIATSILAAATLAQGLIQAATIKKTASQVAGQGNVGVFEQGGLVGGRRHSQGGTIIEAERGEFVMSRNAVESIGLETLNQMNESGTSGNVVVNVSGNVMTQDFVENELAESIKEAVRRGSDFGMS